MLREVSPNNINLNIETLTYRSSKRITWCCLRNSDHDEYTTAVCNRTNSKNPTGCRNCHLDSVRKIDKIIKQNHIDNYIPNLKKSVSIGDDSEIFIENLLVNTNFFKKIERTGQTGEKADIKVTLQNDQIKSLQVKTLSIDKVQNRHYATNKYEYPDDMVIVMVSSDRKFFAVEVYKKIKVTKLTLNFNSKTSKYKNIMF